MNKLLLRRLLYETVEQLVQLEHQVAALVQKTPANALPYVQELHYAAQQLRRRLWDYQGSFLKLFQEAPLEDNLAKTFFEFLLPDFRTESNRLCSALYRLVRPQVHPETDLFLASLQLDKVLPDAPRLITLPGQDYQDKAPDLSSGAFLVEVLPVLDLGSPLRWCGLLETFSRHFCTQTLQISSMLEEMDIPDPKAEFIAPLLNLRVLGPSYYGFYVLNAFERLDATAVWVVEPMLFQALNRFGLVNKDLVILHQSIERAKQHPSLPEPKALTRLLNNEELRETLLKIVERVIPERLAFSEKSLVRSQFLEDRLSRGVLVSAVPMLTSPGQLRDDLSTLGDEQSIYTLLQHLQESPATPREIVNAGWLHKFDESSEWLQAAVSIDADSGWELLKQSILTLDTLLLKSIEISEVHRMLSHEESDALVLA